MTTKTSSVVTEKVEKLEDGQFYMPTYGIIIVLILAFVILKGFIYIKDPDRDGK